VPWEGTGGPLGVFPLNKPRRLPDRLGLIETGSTICDFTFNPFHDDLEVTGLENGHIKVMTLQPTTHSLAHSFAHLFAHLVVE